MKLVPAVVDLEFHKTSSDALEAIVRVLWGRARTEEDRNGILLALADNLGMVYASTNAINDTTLMRRIALDTLASAEDAIVQYKLARN